MNRYFSSFIITASIYTITIISLVYLFNSDNCDADTNIEKSKVIRVSLVNLQKQIKKQEQKPQKKEEIKKVQKPVTKQITKKEPTIELKKEKIQEKKVVEEIVKEEEVVEEVAKEDFTEPEIDEKPVEEETQEEQLQNSASVQSAVVSNEEIEKRQESFFLNLRKLIDRNKSYPNSARRRGVQGNVEMKFCIMQNGHVKDICLVSGKSIFEKSAIEAIEKSFPIDVDKTLFSFPKEFKITIAYILK